MEIFKCMQNAKKEQNRKPPCPQQLASTSINILLFSPIYPSSQLFVCLLQYLKAGLIKSLHP